MITRDELLALLGGLETDRVERTTSTSDTVKFSKAVTAFANDLPGHQQPGYLVVGTNDDGSRSGLQVTDELLQNLAGLRSDGNIQPLPAIAIKKFGLPGGEVAVVEVLPSDLPPVRYKGQVWVRIGPRRGVASEQEERLLSERRVASARTFDAQPCFGSAVSDLAVDLFRINYLPYAVAAEILEENHRDPVEQMSSLRFFDPVRACPTNAAILLFGKNPLEWLPGAYVQFLRVDGPDLASEVVQEKRLSGDLLTLLRELESMMELNLSTFPVESSLLREEAVTTYPAKAIREFLMNAVQHRSYESTAPLRFYWFSDHIEIQNPGGLYGEASPENFPSQNSYRNPILSEAMKTLGFVNRFGRGVYRAQKALGQNGNPAATFDFDNSFVRVTVRMS